MIDDHLAAVRHTTVNGWRRLLALLVGVLAGTVAAVGPAHAGSGSIGVLTFNVCGGYIDTCRSDLAAGTWADRLAQEVTAKSPDVALFQEMCFGQKTSLEERLTGYVATWLTFRADHYGCGKWGSDTRFGLATFVRAPSVQQVYSTPLRELHRETADVRAMLCVKAQVTSRLALVCNVHLGPDLVDGGAAQAAAQIDGWAQGLPVILGGDFNATPQDRNMSHFYRGQGGLGRYTEAAERDRTHFTPNCTGLTACRSGPATTLGAGTPPDPATTVKFDYLFGTADRLVWTNDGVRDTGLSKQDHLLLYGTATWSDDTVAPAAPALESGTTPLVAPDRAGWSGTREMVGGEFTGDGHEDLVVLWWTGAVDLFPGGSGTRFGTPVRLRPAGAGGWSDAVDVTAGEFTGDGRDDLLVRWSAGSLFLYPGTGAGGLGGSTVVKPAGTFSDAVDVTAGDLTGDGRADLLVRWQAGSLFLYPGTGPAALGDSIVLQPADKDGRNRMANQTAVDVTGDGSDDLLVRWNLPEPGTLPDRAGAYVYPASAGGLGGPSLVTTADRSPGWWDAVDVTSGDLTVDGTDDLLVRWNAGSLFLYPGTRTGGVGGSLRIDRPDSGSWAEALDLAVGEFTGDGRGDLAVRWKDGRVTLYPGDGAGRLGPPHAVRPAGAWSDAVEMISGEFTGDGRADLVVRWTAGSVFLYPGDGAGGVGDSIVLRGADSGGWSDARGMTAGDLNADGRDDLLVRWQSGSAFLYPGTGFGGIGGSQPFRSAGAWSDAVDVVCGSFVPGGRDDIVVRWNSGGVTRYPAQPSAGEPLLVRLSDNAAGVDRFDYSWDAPVGTGSPSVGAVQHTAEIPVSGLEPGQHQLYVVAADRLGNRSVATQFAVGR
ncbi:FG-GAP-like repeat-containing protein [Micromonospora sp. NPDC049836]|uniref:FG-GAP-like repeat-containing protein n=1 Tax=Micromonospora sp. NPDC049836 TaxID=3364274 RepID=UPI0037AEFF9E